MSDSKEDIKSLIDNDEGLRSKRKMLTITSLIVLVLSLSGAKVIESNTFILKISFAHQEGIGYLLVVAVVFLLIRYFGYAQKYHEKLYEAWSSRMLRENIFMYYCHHTAEADGLVIDNLPSRLKANIEVIEHEERCDWTYHYFCSFPLKRHIKYWWNDENDDYEEKVGLFSNVSFITYLKILFIEFKYRIANIIAYRESLDVMAPYILGVSAISSYFFSEELQSFLSYFLGK